MHNAVLVMVNLSVRPSVTLVDCAHMVRPTIMISSPYGRPMILVFWRQISTPHFNGMTLKFKIKYKWGMQKCGFQH